MFAFGVLRVLETGGIGGMEGDPTPQPRCGAHSLRWAAMSLPPEERSEGLFHPRGSEQAEQGEHGLDSEFAELGGRKRPQRRPHRWRPRRVRPDLDSPPVHSVAGRTARGRRAGLGTSGLPTSGSSSLCSGPSVPSKQSKGVCISDPPCRKGNVQKTTSRGAA